MISVEALTKDYGSVVAVRDVSFQVKAGEIVGFLGPNGAGKTTTLRILAGFLGATAGRVSIAGFDVATDSLKARQKLGYMPEAAPLYPELRVREYLSFRAALKQVPRQERRSAVDRALEQAAVGDVAETPIGHLSKGYRQRVALADALVSNPPLLILDEPTAGLDPNQIIEVRKLIAELSANHTILLSTHILPEVEAVCDRALVIARGRLLAEGTLAELKALRGGREVAVVARFHAAELEPILLTLPGVARVLVDPEPETRDLARIRLQLADDADAGLVTERAVSVLVQKGAGIRRVSVAGASLEDVFAELTRSEAQPDASEKASAGT
jgi:ABC-2 type transport system ATP-binding protein